MSNDTEIFRAIEKVLEKVEAVKKNPDFSDEVSVRQSRGDINLQEQFDDNRMLKLLAELIAFSQGANSRLVAKMLDEGTFVRLFFGFDISTVAEIDADDWISKHWQEVKVIRFKKKVYSIVNCAKALLEIQKDYGSFVGLLENLEIPRQLRKVSDVDAFWQGFRRLKTELTSVNMPFYKNTTTLLHLLLTIGYDCIKPDLVIMRVAQDIGIVSSTTGDKNLIKVVQTIQRYSIAKNVKPAVIDFYFLIYGGQAWAKQYVVKTPASI